MLNYFLQANLYLIFFYIIYILFLRWETFFRWNRSYLLLTVFISILIPIIPLPNLVKEAPVVENLRDLGEPVLLIATYEDTNQVIEKSYSNEFWLWFVYYCVASIMAIRFFWTVWKIFKLARKYGLQKKQGYYWIQMTDQTQIFSFFHYIFWGMQSELSPKEQSQIIQHELVHARQWHSLDIIALEWLQIFFWFNPACYLMKRSMRQVHEYLADTAVLQQGINKQDYATLLVQQSLFTGKISIGSSFFNQNLLKSRIKMMNQKSSQTSARLKFVLILPILLVCICIAACSKRTLDDLRLSYDQTNLNKLYTHNIVLLKDVIYEAEITLHQNDKYIPDNATVNFYQMKDANTIDHLISSHTLAPGKLAGGKMHTVKFEYKPAKTTLYLIEFLPQNPKASHSMAYGFKSKKKLASASDEDFSPSKATQVIDFTRGSSAEILLENDKVYNFVLDGANNTAKDIAYHRFSNFTLKQPRGIHGFDHNLLRFYPQKSEIYQLELNPKAKLKKPRILVFETALFE